MLIKKIDLYKVYKLERKENYKGYLTIYAETDAREEMNMTGLFPCMLIIPGGGYTFVSKREGEPIAIYYLANGFICAVLDYTCNDKYPRQLIEAMLALKYLKEHSRKYHIRKDKIASIGFSAGAHLLGLLSTINEKEKALINSKTYRPDLSIMSYPVVTSDPAFAHIGSIDTIGMNNDNRDLVSIEKRVDKETPPMFIWHTKEDNCVPFENSILLSDALKRCGIENELVLFEKGWHGLSTCDYNTNFISSINKGIEDASKWKEMSIEFLRDNGFYSKEVIRK